MQHLVTITRRDLTTSQQAVQSAHADIDFTFEHPGRAGPWHKDNYLVMLTVATELDLHNLINICEKNKILYTIFSEPDLGNSITAIALEPGPITEHITRKLPLL
jgi:siroheme synthase (precorrin-2 oxidase/ferrochelatase)